MKNKYHREQSKKAQASLESTKKKKWTLEDMMAQLQRTTPKEIPLNAKHRKLHLLLSTNDNIPNMKELKRFIPAAEDKEQLKKLRSLLEKDLRN